jgi:hypothetical protein
MFAMARRRSKDKWPGEDLRNSAEIDPMFSEIGLELFVVPLKAVRLVHHRRGNFESVGVCIYTCMLYIKRAPSCE